MQSPSVIEPGDFGAIWPSGRSRPLAQLQIDDVWVVALTGARLNTGIEDGLGPWSGIGGKLPSGTWIELLRHELGGPLYALHVDYAANVRDALEEFLTVTKLDRSAVRWRHPET